MLTLKVFLSESGEVSTLKKDFPIFQNVYQNVLLNVFVPTSILSPSFQLISDQYAKIITPYIGGTAVRVASKSVARNGAYTLSTSRYLRYVKTIQNSEDGKFYALFERLLPKEFVTYEGQGINAPKIIANVVNVIYGTISSYTLTSSNVSVVPTTTDEKVKKYFVPVQQNYVFTYKGATLGWTLYDKSILLADYGITITGTPDVNDTITLSVVAATPSVESVVTSQECAYDVLPSSNLVNDDSIDPTELNKLYALLSTLQANVDAKQDSSDTGLQTTQKTIVGAINELATDIAMGEKYVGTYTYTATSVTDLPSDTEMLAFVRTKKGSTYTLQGGELVIVIQQIPDVTDKNYRFYYNKSTSSWDHYEIPPIEKAGNGFAGIVQGTYGVGETANTLVSITNGKIGAIYVKVSGVYTDINSAFLKTDVGATKDFVKDYALPNSFNDRVYFADYYRTSESVATFSHDYTVSTIGNHLTEHWAHTNSTYEYSLSSKNGGLATFNIDSTRAVERDIMLRVYYADMSETTPSYVLISRSYYTLPANTSNTFTCSFDCNLLNNNVIKVKNGDVLRFEIVYIKDDSVSETLTVYGNALKPSFYYLNVNALSLVNGQVLQNTGDSTTNTMSQNAITKYGKNTDIDLTYSNVDIVYDTDDGLQITATGKETKELGNTHYPTIDLKIPLIAGDNIVIDENEDGDKLLIKATNCFYKCTYGTTTADDIATALSNNLTPLVIATVVGSPRLFVYAYSTSTYYYFESVQDNYTFKVQCNISTDEWSYSNVELQTVANKVTAISSSSTDTQYPSAKCVYDSVQGAIELYKCTYGTTTSAQITTAYDSGLLPYLIYSVGGNPRLFMYAYRTSTYYCFESVQDNYTYRVYCNISSSAWGNYTVANQTANNLVTSISASSDNTHYPSALCVYNAIQGAGGGTQLYAHVIRCFDSNESEIYSLKVITTVATVQSSLSVISTLMSLNMTIASYIAMTGGAYSPVEHNYYVGGLLEIGYFSYGDFETVNLGSVISDTVEEL